MNLKGKRGYKIIVHKQFAGISSYFIIIGKEFFVDEHSKHSTTHLLHLLFSAFGHTGVASDQMGVAFRVVAPSPFQGEDPCPLAADPFPLVPSPLAVSCPWAVSYLAVASYLEVACPWAGLPSPWVAVPWLHREAFQL